jgi:broad specificity phosphatase PhoE
MPENLPSDLKNSYYLLRHGQSTANVDEIISSARSLAYSYKHGLTAPGYDQGFESATQLLDLLEGSSKKGDRVVFVSSPFARARETAQACLDGLFQDDENLARWKELGITVTPDIYYHDLLMERYFGRLDNEAIYTYAYVWPLDKMNVTHTAFDVESVAAVCTRWNQLVQDLEKALSKETTTHVICVSHADVLQIAQLYAAQAPNVGDFSSYRFTNGEVRRMEIGTGLNSLPLAKPLPAPNRGTGM